MNVMKMDAQFKDDTEKIIILGTILGSLVIGVFAPLAVLLLVKNYLSESMTAFVKAFFNWQLFLLLCMLIILIPILNVFTILVPIANIIFIIINIIGIANNSQLQLPVIIKVI